MFRCTMVVSLTARDPNVMSIGDCFLNGCISLTTLDMSGYLEEQKALVDSTARVVHIDCDKEGKITVGVKEHLRKWDPNYVIPGTYHSTTKKDKTVSRLEHKNINSTLFLYFIECDPLPDPGVKGCRIPCRH